MDVRNCAKCGRLFQYIGGPPICPNCRRREEEDFDLVKNYIYEHKDANMVEVSRETGVSTRLIERFIREGRLMLSEDSPMTIKCEKCGANIRTGRFCDACSRSLSNEMRISTAAKEAPPKHTEREKDKMHFLNKNRIL